MRERCAIATTALFLLSIPAWAAGVTTVRGELKCDSCNHYSGYIVELQETNRTLPAEQSVVQNTGEFEIRAPAGSYILNVLSNGEVVKSEFISVRDHFTSLTIRLSYEQSKPVTGVISAARLKHKVPKAAEKEFNKAQKCFRSGDLEGSLVHLKRAVEIDEEYLEAWNNLGCRYVMKKLPMEAAAAFRHAIALDPHAPLVHGNLAIALMSLGNVPEAEAVAREALVVDPSDQKARYILGVSLLSQRKFTEEAVKALRQASEAYPRAQLALAQALTYRGDHDGAKAVLKNHLSSGETDGRQQAEAMLSGLR